MANIREIQSRINSVKDTMKITNAMEITLGSSDVMGYKGMGAGFLLIGTAEFQASGPLFEEMHDKCDFANRVMVFTPEKCTQMI